MYLITAAVMVLTTMVVGFTCSQEAALETNRYLVSSKSKSTFMGGVQEDVRKRGFSVVKQMKNVNGFVAYMDKFSAQKLSSRLRVRVEPDFKKHVLGFRRTLAFGCGRNPSPGPVDPPGPEPENDQTKPWGVSRVRADQVSYRGKGIVVCVADTGVDESHVDLKERVIGGESFSGPSYHDGHGHGTHVSGTIAATDNLIGVVGVAPEASIYAVKVLADDGSGYISDIADGIMACADAGADIINLSLGGGGHSQAIQDALIYAQQKGVISVCAAGNDSGPVNYPAKNPECLAISALNEQDKIASFSSRGIELVFIAPGTDVYSTIPGGYDWYSGTSMATPHAAGVLALMLSAGQSIPGVVDVGLRQDQQGNGLIDAVKSTQ